MSNETAPAWRIITKDRTFLAKGPLGEVANMLEDVYHVDNSNTEIVQVPVTRRVLQIFPAEGVSVRQIKPATGESASIKI
jgi:hypothetical protein